MKVYLIGCGKRKAEQASAAKDLYQGELFKRCRELAELRADRWFILSAYHGLLDPGKVIEPYDMTLSGANKARRHLWGRTVLSELVKTLDIRMSEPKKIDITLLAGTDYRESLHGKLLGVARTVSIPLRGLGIGQQISTLKAMIETARAGK